MSINDKDNGHKGKNNLTELYNNIKGLKERNWYEEMAKLCRVI